LEALVVLALFPQIVLQKVIREQPEKELERDSEQQVEPATFSFELTTREAATPTATCKLHSADAKAEHHQHVENQDRVEGLETIAGFAAFAVRRRRISLDLKRGEKDDLEEEVDDPHFRLPLYLVPFF